MTKAGGTLPRLSLWFGRFEALPDGPEHWLLRDWLQPQPVRRERARFAGLDGDALSREFFAQGFAPAVWGGFPSAVNDRPRNADDAMFWQFPCRTEAAAFEVHAALDAPAVHGNELHCYLGLPWATFIDRRQWPAAEMQAARTRLRGLAGALSGYGMSLRVHTVCQHIDWKAAVKHWHGLGVTDIWLSHLPAHTPADALHDGLHLHPWPLFAVNVEDPERRVGLRIGADPAERRWLASFAGAHMPHYLSDARLRLRALSSESDCKIAVTTDAWHFEGVVYGHQVRNEPVNEHYVIDDSVRQYNEWLSESVFGLCPAGAGPNTLRLWEALAVGAIPVLLGPEPALPSGGNLPAIDWDGIVLRFDTERITELPAFLRRIPLSERRRRQRLGLQAYAQVREQRCF